MTQPSGRLAASRRAQRSKAVIGHHSQFVAEHTHWPATTTNEKTITRHSRGLWFRYSGRLLKPVWRSPIARHTRAAFVAAVQGTAALARRRASALHARSCRGRDTLGRRATRSSPACGEGRPRDLPPVVVLRTAFPSPSASKNTPARVRSAALNWRASARCAPSSASVWREVNRRLGFLLLRAGGLKGDGADCHIACPIPIGTSLPPREDLPRPHQRHHLRDVTNRRRG